MLRVLCEAAYRFKRTPHGFLSGSISEFLQTNLSSTPNVFLRRQVTRINQGNPSNFVGCFCKPGRQVLYGLVCCKLQGFQRGNFFHYWLRACTFFRAYRRVLSFRLRSNSLCYGSLRYECLGGARILDVQVRRRSSRVTPFFVRCHLLRRVAFFGACYQVLEFLLNLKPKMHNQNRDKFGPQKKR